MTEAIAQEIHLQKDYLPTQKIRTIYFGGGTPSLLSEAQIRLLLDTIYQEFAVDPQAEITLEANPDDLTEDKLQELKHAGINRLSIGIQSFHQPHLAFMNRAHNSQEALSCVKNALAAGFNDLSLDLIYGIPLQGRDAQNPDPHWVWKEDVAKILELRPNHLSAYCLTIEPQTVFGRWETQNKLPAIDEELAAQQFEYLLETTAAAGYEQYEISNFCLPTHYSKHNSSYWLGIPYLGVGPSAHSFNGLSRQYNIKNNTLYIKSLNNNQVPSEKEELSISDQINDYLMTALRTKWGIDLTLIQQRWGFDLKKERNATLTKHLGFGNIKEESGLIYLTTSGKLLADQITTELMA